VLLRAGLSTPIHRFLKRRHETGELRADRSVAAEYSANLEGVMRVMTEPRSSRLPKTFPIGAVYVVEGTGGGRGRLRISARYVIMPGGRRIEVPAKAPEATAVSSARARWRRLRLVGSGRPAERPKEFSHGPKKIAVASGTMRQERR
jgi:hypothetical protein